MLRSPNKFYEGLNMNKFTQLLKNVPKLDTPKHLPRNSVLYLHRRATDRVPMYVGIGKPDRPEVVGKVGDGNRNDDWHEVYNEHGRTVEVLMEGLLEWHSKAIEVVYIFDYRRVYGRYREGGSITNLSDGGEGGSGYKWTEEQLVKISGENHHFYGKNFSQEHRAKISASMAGEHCYAYGIFGEQASAFQGYSIGINEKQFVILSGSQEMKDNSFNPGNISLCVSGTRTIHKGFRWTRHSTLNPEDFAGLTPFNELSAERLNAAKTN